MGSQLKPLKIRWFCSRASGDNTYPVTTCVTTFGQHLPRALRAHSLDSGGTCEVGKSGKSGHCVAEREAHGNVECSWLANPRSLSYIYEIRSRSE
jgi:hypothetical protein